MPPRLISFCIVGFWLGTMGHLLLREWHYRREAPPAVTDTVAEAATSTVEWHIFRRTRGPEGHWHAPKQVGVVVSQVQRDESHHVTSLVHQLELDVGQLWKHWPMQEPAGLLRLESRLELGVFGEIQRLRIVGGWKALSRWLLLADLVPRAEQQATLRLLINLPGRVWRQEYVLPWSNKALPLNSLGPPDRLPGLRPGQRWDISSLDVLSFSSLPGATVTGWVHPQTVPLTWQGQSLPCLVVQLQRPGLDAEWWVAQDEPMRHWVVQQVVRWPDTEMVLVRQPQVLRHDLLVPPAWFYRLP
ncbi:MAG: hypothetical protein RMI91_05605 [Gemmatales bacterium]|nr:hypothetical protein [Gemmatales bacterium]MDW7994110.1 hypothetical protein [Gemmatales bacterium]